jgi:hypothetical protein
MQLLADLLVEMDSDQEGMIRILEVHHIQ